MRNVDPSRRSGFRRRAQTRAERLNFYLHEIERGKRK